MFTKKIPFFDDYIKEYLINNENNYLTRTIYKVPILKRGF